MLKIPTRKLKDAVEKVGKMIGSNSVMEICNYLEIIYSENQLVMTATDKTMAITVVVDIEEQDEEDFEVVVEGKKFCDLVKNSTVDTIKVTPEDYHLKFVGNGNYKIKYFNSRFFEYDVSPEYVFELDGEQLLKIISRHEGTVYEKMGVLGGFYITNQDIVTLDNNKMALTQMSLFDEDVELLIPAELMEFVQLFDKSSQIKLMVDGQKVLFSDNSLSVFGGQLYGIEEYPDISSYKSMEFENFAKVEVELLKKSLKRVGLFVIEEDEFGVNVMLKDGVLSVWDTKNQSLEEVDCLESEGTFDCTASLTDLQLFLKNIGAKNVILKFDGGRALNMTNEHIETNYYSAIIRDKGGG